jgi:elongation factor G
VPGIVASNVYAAVNKLDRDGADLDAAVDTLRTRLDAQPWLLQRPLERDGKLVGVVDLPTLTALEFHGRRGEHVTRRVIDDDCFVAARDLLLETMAEHDDAILAKLIDSEPVTSGEIRRAVRDAVRSRATPVVPVLCGAAYRNIGVQPLLDAVCAYLPPPSVTTCDPGLRALVFKVR